MRTGGLVILIYIVIGVVVAANQGYFGGISRLGDVLEIIIAVLAWPLLLFGIDIEIGGGPKIDEGLRLR